MVFSPLLKCQQSFVQMLLHHRQDQILFHLLQQQRQQNLNVQYRLEKQQLHLLQHPLNAFVLQQEYKSVILLLGQYVAQALLTSQEYAFSQPFLSLYFSQLGELIKPYVVLFALSLHPRLELHHSSQFHACSGYRYPVFA